MDTLTERGFDPARVEQEGGPEFDIRHYLEVLLRFKWGILGIALLAALFGVYYAYKAIPIYRSTTTLQIAKEQNNLLAGGYYFPSWDFKFYETQYELIRSYSVAEIAASRLGLLDADHLEGKSEVPAEPGFSWRSLMPAFMQREPVVITPEIRRANIIKGLQGRVRIEPIEGSELVTVSFESRDPDLAADQANAISEAYIDFLRDKNLSDITGDQTWYSSRLVQAREDLDKAERELQDFLDRQGLVQTSEGVDAIQNQALQLALTQREEARQQKLALERLNRDIEEARAIGGSLANINALNERGIVTGLRNNLSSARQEVSQLSQRYGPKHPRMIEARSAVASAEAAYESELQAVADSVVADYQRAVRTEAEYDRQLNSAQADIQVLNRSRAELTKLQDNVATSRALFEQLQSGEKRAEILEGGVHKISASVIESARPGLRPVRPNKRRVVLLWLLGGLAVGVGLAFLLDQMDNTFNGSEDVERRLNLPVLGQLAQLKVDKDSQLSPMNYFVDEPRSAFSEAIRTIRTGVMLSTLDQERSIIAVTSSVPGEGKTTLAINLAHAIAQMKSTLLIDADMRRPMVHKAKKIGQPRPGLAALMTGEATLEEALEEQQDGLNVIPSGTVPPNPLELISSQKFKDLVRRLQNDYEVIIIDSAPALAVSDALVVSQLADALLYVIRADATPYQAAEQGIKRLRRVNAPLMGCVLNQVVTGSRGYGYKYGKYGRYYRYYRYGRYGYGRYGYYQPDYYHEYYGEDEDKSA